MRTLYRVALALSLAAVFLAAPRSKANCSTARIITSATAFTNASFFYTPGNPFDGPNHPYAPGQVYGGSNTYWMRGSFWSFGAGNPAAGLGNDCGTECGYATQSVWLHPGYFGYGYLPGLIGGQYSHWQYPTIDGCITINGSDPILPDASECMVALVSDQDMVGGGFFAILATTAKQTYGYDFHFIQPGNAPFNLVAVPPPTVQGTISTGANEVEIEVLVSDTTGADDGKYLECSAHNDAILLGYKIVASSAPPGGEAPLSRLHCTTTTQDCDHVLPSENWVTLPLTDLSGVSKPYIALGQASRVQATCTGSADLYLATVLVFDSGFETPYVSASSQPVSCGNCTGADADGDGSCVGSSTPDCDDSDPTVHPGAAQVCDGQNNDCNDPSWPDVPADEIDLDGDSYPVCAGDCDETDPSRNPNRPELCNQEDDNCNGLVDENESGPDSDGDGVAAACDNCAFLSNGDQSDEDSDAIGDGCDSCDDTAPGDPIAADGCSVCSPDDEDGDGGSGDDESGDGGGGGGIDDDEENDQAPVPGNPSKTKPVPGASGTAKQLRSIKGS